MTAFAAHAIDARAAGMQLEQTRDGVMVRCATCRVGRLIWRHERAERVRTAFREFLQVHRRCSGAVSEGAPVHAAIEGAPCRS